jgi:putative nucleotidyltransferase with HDIG domain/PAS domain S-box-containing protein
MNFADTGHEDILRQIIATLPFPIAVYDDEGETRLVNDAYVKMLGLESPDEVIGKSNIRHSRQMKELGLEKEVEKAFRGERLSYVEYAVPASVIGLEHKTNRLGTIYLQMMAFPLKDAAGKIVGVLGAFEDATERVLLRQRIEDSLTTCQRLTNATVKSLSRIIELRDPYTAGHQMRVQQLACAIAEEIGLDPIVVEKMKIAGLVHDIGKILLPSEILSKPGALSDFEYAIVKNHPEAGRTVLDDTEFDPLIIDIVTQHHERINGSGYPLGLVGEEITPEARIYAVADVVEAMAAHRPYRPALGIEAALKEIEDNKGILYDETFADVCLNLFRKKGFKFAKVPGAPQFLEH